MAAWVLAGPKTIWFVRMQLPDRVCKQYSTYLMSSLRGWAVEIRTDSVSPVASNFSAICSVMASFLSRARVRLPIMIPESKFIVDSGSNLLNVNRSRNSARNNSFPNCGRGHVFIGLLNA